MALPFTFVTCGILCLIPVFLFLYYRNEKKKFQGIPFHNVVMKIVCDHVTGKKTKDVPFNSYLFYTMIDIAKQYTKEGLFSTYLFQPIMFIFGEEAMKFFSNEKATIDKTPEYNIIQEIMGAGLLTSNGERWKTHRKLINPVFHFGMLKDKVPLFNKHAAVLVKDMEKLAGKSSVDLLNSLKCNYFNALSESVFGLKQSEENKAENLRCFSLIDSLTGMLAQRMFHPWFRPKFLLKFSSFGRKFLKQNEEYKNFITKIINDMNQQVTSNTTVDAARFSNHLQKSFTYILFSQHLNNPSFTLQDVHDEVSTVFITGYDTVTYSTLWCLFMLGLHPEVQEMAFNEVESIADDYITYEDSCNLTYLEAVILETLRLYPIVPLLGRVLSEDVQYGKYKVHKGTSIAFLAYMSHRNPDIYPNPERFEPERFLNAESKRPWSFVPFGEGSRTCIGKKYSLIEMKIFLSYMLRNFKISSLDRREDIRICWAVGLIPARPIRMKITPRNKGEILYNKEEEILPPIN